MYSHTILFLVAVDLLISFNGQIEGTLDRPSKLPLDKPIKMETEEVINKSEIKILEECSPGITGANKDKMEKIKKVLSENSMPSSSQMMTLNIPFDTIHQLSLEKSLDVFISYRRINGSPLTRWLKKNLEDHGFSVIIDEDIIDLEGTFVDNLLLSITRAKNLILVLTENALDRCINDEKCQDWVHYEIVIALHSHCNIIPITDNFQWPKPGQLPKDMESILSLDGIKWVHDYQNQQICLDKLVEYIKNQEVP